MGMSELLIMVESLQHRPANDDERELANEIVHVVDERVVEAQEDPAFGTMEMDEAVMIEMAWRESTFKRNAVGDHGRSIGYFQMQRLPKSILKDAHRQAVIAYDRLRDSAKSCGHSAPLAKYASGNCAHGRELSAFRMREARHLVSVASAELSRRTENEGATRELNTDSWLRHSAAERRGMLLRVQDAVSRPKNGQSEV
jgi:hypothetical protein